jgi:hypothetical protein
MPWVFAYTPVDPGCGFRDKISANRVSEGDAPVDQPLDVRDTEPLEVVIASGVHADEDHPPRTVINVDDWKRRTAQRIDVHWHGDLSSDLSISGRWSTLFDKTR